VRWLCVAIVVSEVAVLRTVGLWLYAEMQHVFISVCMGSLLTDTKLDSSSMTCPVRCVHQAGIVRESHTSKRRIEQTSTRAASACPSENQKDLRRVWSEGRAPEASYPCLGWEVWQEWSGEPGRYVRGRQEYGQERNVIWYVCIVRTAHTHPHFCVCGDFHLGTLVMRCFRI
jgi:hypothetical protein